MNLLLRPLVIVYAVLLCSIVRAESQPAIDQSIVAEGPLGTLQGSMLEAKEESAPIVLIIPGSGPTDRNGNNPLGVNASTYRLLAKQLAALDVTTIRIDKRGMFGSSNAVNDPNAVTMNDYSQDIRSWISAIRQRKNVHCVWLLGHSEGGLVALVASQNDVDVCGLILVATPGRRLGELLLEQLIVGGLEASLITQASAAVRALEAGHRVNRDGLHESLQPLFPDVVQDFLISAFALDPAELISRYDGRILILQGDRDLQVPQTDADLLFRAARASTLVYLPGINHVLKHVGNGSRAANLATYSNPELPIAPEVGKLIADFVSAAP